jgi:hypothetical protein
MLCAHLLPLIFRYNLNSRQLEDLLANLQGKGRVTVENGVYKYRSTGKTPQGKRAGSPTPPAGVTLSDWGQVADCALLGCNRGGHVMACLV